MNWLKVGAVVIGGIIVFFIFDSVIHVLLSLLTAIAFVAIVAGGAYVAVKINGARKRHQVKHADRDDEREVRRERAPRETAIAPVRPAPPTPAPAPRHDVEDDLARLKREMGH